MIIMNELFWTLFLLTMGACFGWTVCTWRHEKNDERRHARIMGMMDPHIAHWFHLRSGETDPYWANMPLREYANRKRLAGVDPVASASELSRRMHDKPLRAKG